MWRRSQRGWRGRMYVSHMWSCEGVSIINMGMIRGNIEAIMRLINFIDGEEDVKG